MAAVAIFFGAGCAALLVVTPWTAVPGGAAPPTMAQALPILAYFVAGPIVGALIVSRARGNPVGWLLIIQPGALAFGFLASSLGAYTIATGGRASDAVLMNWLGSWVSAPAFGAIPLLAALYPTGRPLSHRWRPLIWIGVVATLALTLGELVQAEIPIVSGADKGPAAPNPAGIGLGPLSDVLIGLGLAGILGSATAGTVSLALRFRRARGVERQQLKWFMVAMALLAGSLLLMGVANELSGPVPAIEPLSEALWVLATSSLVLLPLSAGIAILRYRLYDIDVLINRALVYGALTAALGATYVGSVLALQAVLRPFTAGSDIAVAVSTLAVVALFQPLRRRFQDAVDRRFYRARYDAQRTLDDLADRMRDEVDLGDLQREVIAIVDRTMQPAHAALWLRERR